LWTFVACCGNHCVITRSAILTSGHMQRMSLRDVAKSVCDGTRRSPGTGYVGVSLPLVDGKDVQSRALLQEAHYPQAVLAPTVHKSMGEVPGCVLLPTLDVKV
jgi:hypothetical protein